MKRVGGTFTNDSYEEELYDEREGAELGRVRITRSFSGEIAGQSTAELLTATAADGSAAYVGLDRISASLEGKAPSAIARRRPMT